MTDSISLRAAIAALVCVLSLGCEKAVREVVYDVYEKVGIHKRDLLKKRVDNIREEQQQASDEFKDALTQLKEMTSFEGGELESRYNELKISYERSSREAEDVRQGIRDIERVAGDLFEEWEAEIPKISTPSLREQSRRTLHETQRRYETLHSSLKSSEAKLDPVLIKFQDQVLSLKHNLNAQAVGSLRLEVASVQRDVEKLIHQMNTSMAQADRFVQTLP